MIDSKKIKEFVEDNLKDTDCFLVDLTVSPSNGICVEIDSMENVDIDFCIELTRKIEEAFPRDEEDYELEVGSSGLTTPFKDIRQYKKHIGDDVEVLDKTGKKYKGELKEADDTGFTIEVEEKVKEEGKKRPVFKKREIRYNYDEVKSVVYSFDF